MTKNEYKRIKKKFYFDVSYVVCGTALIMTIEILQNRKA